jgi:2-polyprenyl-3-methyl-5-hydroxy-6-metoxy-1,4-benzoquinol methylase
MLRSRVDERQVSMARRLRRDAKRVRDFFDEWGRRLGLLSYRPERRTSAEWSTAYGAGSLAYYEQLDELGRYSAIVGYVGWIASTLEPSRAPSVLDVGCGSGLLRRRLAGLDLSEYVGIDLSDAAIEAARSESFAHSRFVVGDVATEALGEFDVVVLNEVLYYAADAQVFLRRIDELVREGGFVVVSMWRHPGDQRLWKTVEDALHVVDRVEIRNRANAMNGRGWIVALCGGRA